jgi:hypothetical protein
MTRPHAFRSWVLAVVAVLLVGLPAGAQQTTDKPFEPTVGQAGKDVVWVPTPQALVEKMLDMAKLTAQDFYMDLGSGDGRTVITAARRGARSVGVEFNPKMVDLARRNAQTAGVTARATFQEGDLFQADISKANVITLFLLPSINMKLRPKILELRPGTRIVSNTFSMEDWEADETQTISGDCSAWCTALLWIVPAKVDGTWKVGQAQLTLAQRFQMLTGTLGSVMISNGRVRGNEVTFTAGNATYSGQVEGNTIKGMIKGGPGGAFTATR